MKSQRTGLSVIRFLQIAILMISALGLLVLPGRASDPPKTTGRLIVKLRAPMAGQVENALPSQIESMVVSRGQATGQLGQFMAQYSMQRLKPLYPHLVQAKKLRGLSDYQLAQEVQQKFAQRAQRHRGAFRPPELSRTYVVEMTDSSPAGVALALEQLQADAVNVEYAEEERISQVVQSSGGCTVGVSNPANCSPNDPYLWTSGSWGQSFDDLWGMWTIGAPTA